MRFLSLYLFAIALFFLASTSEAFANTRVLILGDSLTEGYGIERAKAFPGLLQEMLKAKNRNNVEVVVSGVSGSTSASGPKRLKWFLKNPPQILVLELGGNDMLRGISPEVTKKNLKETIQMAKTAKIKVLLAGMRVPPNYGREYAKNFETLYTDLAKTEKVDLIPFILEKVGGVASLNQDDGLHPNEKGHAVMAETVYKYLEPLL